MLSWFVGQVDVPAAAVLVAIVIGTGIGFASFIVVYKSKQEVHNKFELAKMAQQAETQIKLQDSKLNQETALAKIAANREVEVRRIDTGMLEGTRVVQEQRRSEEG